MEEDGFIKYYQAVPSLALFNFASVNHYRFEALNVTTKHRVVENIRKAPNVVEAIDYLGQATSVSLAGASKDYIEGGSRNSGKQV